MAGPDYPIYDADNHLYEKEDCFTRHLDPRVAREAIAWVDVKGRRKLAICGTLTNYIPNPTFDVVATPGSLVPWHRGINPGGRSIRDIFQAGGLEACRPEFKDRDARLRTLDAQGLHAALIYGTLVNAIEHRMKERPDLLHATLHAYNRWMEEDWGFAHQGRLFAAPVLSLVDLERACAELDWCLAHGARAIQLRPAPVHGHPTSRAPSKPEFDPFWARVHEAGIAVALHVTDSGYGDLAAQWDGGSELTPFAPSAFRQMIVRERPIYDTVANMIVDGLFQRHPRVRVASVENGSLWVPMLLQKLDKVHRQLPGEFHEPPLDTFRRHVWVVPEYGEDIRGLADSIGVGHVLFGSDFPHAEGYAAPTEWVEELAGFSAQETRQIMSENLASLLRPPTGPRL
jgi:predicted TIM-barrel fold metal-dependent hydrolase